MTTVLNVEALTGAQWALLLGGVLGAGVGVPVGRWTAFWQLRNLAPVARVWWAEFRRRRRMRVRRGDRHLVATGQLRPGR